MIESVKKVFRFSKSKLIAMEEARVVRFYFRKHKRMINSPEIKAIWEKVKLTKQQEKEIDEFYISNYGQKVPHVWHRFYTAFTGNFDVRYISEPLYVFEAERLMNSKREYVKALQDKNLLPMIAKAAGIKTPEVILSRTNGIFRNGENNIISEGEALEIFKNSGEVFFKPSIDSCGGASCCCINYAEGGGDFLKKRNIVIQKRLKCHSSIADIYSGSVNTFRIVTYLWQGSIIHCPIVLRIGRGGKCVDNGSSGGIFIAVDDDGTLHRNAFSEYCEKFSEHPDTHVIFEGRKINFADKAIEAAKKMHSMIPQVGMINWDFTIDQNGAPVMIEGNMYYGGGVWLMQDSHGHGIFGEKTAEILRWIRKVKKVKFEERINYMYGNDI